MLHPTMHDLLEKVGNRYLLVNVAAKRAREIAEDAEVNEKKLSDKPVTLALEEIAADKIVMNDEAPAEEAVEEAEAAEEAVEA